MNKKLPKRKENTHKGDYGRVLIVAGSSGMTGAAILAARGALRSGAGLTYLAVPKKLVDLVDSTTPEIITVPFEGIKSIKADAIAVGPGLGVSTNTKKLLSSLISRSSALVIDADALNVIAKNTKLLKNAKANIVITPHPGEMSRLIKKSIVFVQRHRSVVAKMAAHIFKCVVVLKGHRTVIADPSGKTYINQTGNPGMASGGVGDVLTGMIASFIGQGIPLFESAVLAVNLHGRAGDLAAKEKGEYGMIASDLVERIPDAIQ
ncbi:MAG: NAD(P)H-hydrate dehydratase [Candidatus Margulisiibacteriota bacterium]